MRKQNRFYKFIICVLLIIPIALFVAGTVQTFVIKDLQKQSMQAETNLETANDDKKEKSDELEYKNSDEYNDDYLEHENGYGNEGDVNIETD